MSSESTPTIAIEQAGEHSGGSVRIRGWLYNLRESGKLLFPIFRDGTGLLQGVVSLQGNPEAFGALKGLTQESSVMVTGKIQAEPRAPGGYEIHVSGVEVVQRDERRRRRRCDEHERSRRRPRIEGVALLP